MSFGLTVDGFVKKRLSDIREEMETSLKNGLGAGINLQQDQLLGQVVGILSEREALLWEGLEAVYNSQSPDSATGESLDNVAAITGIERLSATKGTGTVTAYGTLSTVIPSGSIISVSGNPDARFVTIEDNTIGAGTDEVQDIDFSSVPDSGAWTLVFDGEETGSLAYNDNAAAIQSALNALSNLSAVTVSGNYTDGFTVTFASADGDQDQPLLQAGSNTLTASSVQVNLTFAETTPGVLPNVDMTVEAETAGNIPAYAGTLTVIETPVSGWDSVTNAADITEGNDIETDAALRLRRLQTLANPGSTTVDAIRAKLLQVENVTSVSVFENDTDSTDASGRPPHSFEAVVQGGVGQTIADEIWENKAAGIQTFGSSSDTVTDTMGYTHTVYYSRPSEITIYVIVNLTTTSDYPVDGDDAVAEAIADYGDENLGIGDDVLHHKLFCPLEDIAGITDVEILIGTSPTPTAEDNISIDDDEIADFDTANITVNS